MFFPTNLDLANILGRTDLDVLFYFLRSQNLASGAGLWTGPGPDLVGSGPLVSRGQQPDTMGLGPPGNVLFPFTVTIEISAAGSYPNLVKRMCPSSGKSISFCWFAIELDRFGKSSGHSDNKTGPPTALPPSFLFPLSEEPQPWLTTQWQTEK